MSGKKHGPGFLWKVILLQRVQIRTARQSIQKKILKGTGHDLYEKVPTAALEVQHKPDQILNPPARFIMLLGSTVRSELPRIRSPNGGGAVHTSNRHTNFVPLAMVMPSTRSPDRVRANSERGITSFSVV